MKKKPVKILLAYPRFLDTRKDQEDVSAIPIGVFYIAALLIEEGYPVKIVNWFDRGKDSKEVISTIREESPDIIGFSVLHGNRWGAIELAKLAKAANPYVKIVFGGVGATFLWNHFLTYFPEIDFVVTGEGEYTFLELVRAIDKNAPLNLRNIQGLAYRKDNKNIINPRRGLIANLNHLPDPAQYFTFNHVVSSRGCPWACTFCGSPGFWNRRLRFHSPEYFVNQLEKLHDKGVNFFYVSDDTFTINKERVIQICRLILQRRLNITWQAISRVNYVDEDILYWMRLAGCIQISYGVESGSRKIRERLNKKIKDSDIKKAFSLTRKYGILPRAYFIYGSPGETDSTIEESIKLINHIKPLSMVSYILDIFPGTALYENFKKKLNVTDDIWLQKLEDIMYFEIDSALSQEQILSFGKKLRNAFFANLHKFACDVELIDKIELYPFHADFLSRLGMTFTHGDYSENPMIKEKEKTAEFLYTRALDYHPDHRAFLGLGILFQKQGRYNESIHVLQKGINHYPKSEQLHVCLGVSFMNVGDFKTAISHFLKFPPTHQTAPYIATCYRAIGEPQKAQKYVDILPEKQ